MSMILGEVQAAWILALRASKISVLSVSKHLLVLKSQV